MGSVFVWTEGLYRHTAEQAFLLTEEMVVPYLVHRGLVPLHPIPFYCALS